MSEDDLGTGEELTTSTKLAVEEGLVTGEGSLFWTQPFRLIPYSRFYHRSHVCIRRIKAKIIEEEITRTTKL